MGLRSREGQIDTHSSRRNFIRSLLGFSVIASLGGVLAPIIGFLFPRSHQSSERGGRVKVASLAEIQAAGGIVVPANNQAVILTASQGTQISAFSAICTHLGCVVKWKSAAGYIECPCHDGRFNAQTGAVISGPAPSPLVPREVIIEGDDVYVVT